MKERHARPAVSLLTDKKVMKVGDESFGRVSPSAKAGGGPMATWMDKRTDEKAGERTAVAHLRESKSKRAGPFNSSSPTP